MIGEVIITLDGVSCVMVSVTDTEIICTTGAKNYTEPDSTTSTCNCGTVLRNAQVSVKIGNNGLTAVSVSIQPMKRNVQCRVKQAVFESYYSSCNVWHTTDLLWSTCNS